MHFVRAAHARLFLSSPVRRRVASKRLHDAEKDEEKLPVGS